MEKLNESRICCLFARSLRSSDLDQIRVILGSELIQTQQMGALNNTTTGRSAKGGGVEQQQQRER